MVKKLGSIIIIVSVIVLPFRTFAVAAEKSLGFPQKAIRFIVPYPVGSGSDIQCRGVLPYVEKHLGVKILIDSRPGADSRLGLNAGWKAVPDGYTLVLPGMPAPIINEKLFPVDYKTREFTHIYAWSQDNMVLVTNSETWRTLEEFIATARTKTLSCGVTGTAGLAQIIGLQLEEAAELKPVNWVPFDGGVQTVTNLAGKHIDFGITATTSAKALVDAGKLRPLLIFSNEKDPTFPDVPFIKKTSLKLTPMPLVRAVFAPPGLSPKIANIVEKAFARAIKEPALVEWANKTRMTIAPLNSKELLAYTIDVEREVSKYIDKAKVK